MMLPLSCKINIQLTPSAIPTADVTYSFTLSKQSHVIIMYQYAGPGVTHML